MLRDSFVSPFFGMVNIMKFFSIFFLSCLTFTVGSACADEKIDQKNKQFSKKEITIKVGDSVEFKNSDPLVHNVFSLSTPRPFDLGFAPQGQVDAIKFDKPGDVDVECAIHPTMALKIHVVK